MKAAFSLRWKILAWFFVNLAVIGAVIFVFLRAQFHVGINSLLAGPTNARLDAVARPLITELRKVPAGEWGPVLERATGAFRKPGGNGVRSAIFRNDGTCLTGEIRELPREVLAKLAEHERARPDAPPGSEPPRRPPANPQASPDRERASSDERLEKFLLTAGTPRLYWAGVRLGFVERAAGGRPRFVTLLLASDSLRGGGLFFDYTPWLWLGTGLVLLSVLLWLPFVHGLTRALARMTRTAEAIAEGRFDAPHVSGRRDEIGRLGRALAHMAARLDGFVTGQKRFLGDTAHELLSPLARLEVALSILERQSGPDAHSYAARALGDVRHISALVHELLSFSKAGLRAPGAALQPVALAALARDVALREAPDARLDIAIPADLRVLAEPDLLARALGNVVRNALRYAGDAGPVHLHAAAAGAEVILSVTDHGPGVPPDALERLFDPFFRPDVARTPETGGTGLGLAIVKSCIEACGGWVTVRNRDPHGLQLDFTLQRAASLPALAGDAAERSITE